VNKIILQAGFIVRHSFSLFLSDRFMDFHPYLYEQHVKSPVLEFPSFNKVSWLKQNLHYYLV